MTTKTNQSKPQTQTSQKIQADKQALYGEFIEDYKKNSEWRRNLAKKSAHKALDIPMGNDDVNISPQTTNNVTNHNGVGSKSVLGAVVLTVLGMLGAGGLGFMLKEGVKNVSTTPNTDTNTQYRFEIDKDDSDSNSNE